MAMYRADFRVLISVEFEDDGKNDLTDQASDALKEAFEWKDGDLVDMEIIGKPTAKGKSQ